MLDSELLVTKLSVIGNLCFYQRNICPVRFGRWMVAGTELRGKGGLMETGESDWVNPSDLADSSTVLIFFLIVYHYASDGGT